MAVTVFGFWRWTPDRSRIHYLSRGAQGSNVMETNSAAHARTDLSPAALQAWLDDQPLIFRQTFATRGYRIARITLEVTTDPRSEIVSPSLEGAGA